MFILYTMPDLKKSVSVAVVVVVTVGGGVDCVVLGMVGIAPLPSSLSPVSRSAHTQTSVLESQIYGDRHQSGSGRETDVTNQVRIVSCALAEQTQLTSRHLLTDR